MKHGWEIKKLGEFIKEYSVRNKNGVDFPVYSVTNSQGFCKDYFSKEVASKEKSTYKIVPRGCFAYNPSRINVGSVDWQNHENNVIVSPLYVVFEVSDKLNNDFLLYYLKSNHTMQLIKNLATGTVRANLKFDILSSFPIPIPPLSIQERIVSELDCINGILEKKREQIKELDALAQSIFYDMFGDPIQNEKGWEVKKWNDLFDTILGKMLDKKKQSDSDILLPYLANPNVLWGNFSLNDLREMTFSDKERKKLKLEVGDLLICEGGESGRCAVWKGSSEEILFQKAIHRARIKKQEQIEPLFASIVLKELKKNGGLKNYISKSTIEHLTGEKLNLIPIILPPLSLQQAFAAKIEAIEKQKELVKRSIAETETLLASRMQHYFEA